jgi:hypothetical protein
MIFDTQKTREWRLPLHTLLSKTRGCQSSDLRDRVFAIVGLSSDTNVDLIDYNAGFSDILTKVNASYMQGIIASPSVSTFFDYLCFVHDSDIESLPSLVPSFNLPQSFWNMDSIFWTEKEFNNTPKIHCKVELANPPNWPIRW